MIEVWGCYEPGDMETSDYLLAVFSTLSGAAEYAKVYRRKGVFVERIKVDDWQPTERQRELYKLSPEGK